ncbi:hypothetical protein BIW11_08328, partial [Tropilaelaps mercedesae]
MLTPRRLFALLLLGSFTFVAPTNITGASLAETVTLLPIASTLNPESAKNGHDHAYIESSEELSNERNFKAQRHMQYGGFPEKSRVRPHAISAHATAKYVVTGHTETLHFGREPKKSSSSSSRSYDGQPFKDTVTSAYGSQAVTYSGQAATSQEAIPSFQSHGESGYGPITQKQFAYSPSSTAPTAAGYETDIRPKYVPQPQAPANYNPASLPQANSGFAPPMNPNYKPAPQVVSSYTSKYQASANYLPELQAAPQTQSYSHGAKNPTALSYVSAPQAQSMYAPNLHSGFGSPSNLHSIYGPAPQKQFGYEPLLRVPQAATSYNPPTQPQYWALPQPQMHSISTSQVRPSYEQAQTRSVSAPRATYIKKPQQGSQKPLQAYLTVQQDSARSLANYGGGMKEYRPQGGYSHSKPVHNAQTEYSQSERVSVSKAVNSPPPAMHGPQSVHPPLKPDWPGSASKKPSYAHESSKPAVRNEATPEPNPSKSNQPHTPAENHIQISHAHTDSKPHTLKIGPEAPVGTTTSKASTMTPSSMRPAEQIGPYPSATSHGTPITLEAPAPKHGYGTAQKVVYEPKPQPQKTNYAPPKQDGSGDQKIPEEYSTPDKPNEEPRQVPEQSLPEDNKPTAKQEQNNGDDHSNLPGDTGNESSAHQETHEHGFLSIDGGFFDKTFIIPPEDHVSPAVPEGQHSDTTDLSITPADPNYHSAEGPGSSISEVTMPKPGIAPEREVQITYVLIDTKKPEVAPPSQPE